MSNTYSFPPSARLSTPDDYKQVFNKSKKFHYLEFTVFVRKIDVGGAKLGLAVSKKVDKRAVVRNKIKRIIRESFRVHQSTLSGLEIVFVAKPAINKLDNKQLAELLESVWQKLGLTCAN